MNKQAALTIVKALEQAKEEAGYLITDKEGTNMEQHYKQHHDNVLDALLLAYDAYHAALKQEYQIPTQQPREIINEKGLDAVIRDDIDNWLDENDKEASEQQIAQMIRGVRNWYSETVNDSIDAAYDSRD